MDTILNLFGEYPPGDGQQVGDGGALPKDEWKPVDSDSLIDDLVGELHGEVDLVTACTVGLVLIVLTACLFYWLGRRSGIEWEKDRRKKLRQQREAANRIEQANQSNPANPVAQRPVTSDGDPDYNPKRRQRFDPHNEDDAYTAMRQEIEAENLRTGPPAPAPAPAPAPQSEPEPEAAAVVKPEKASRTGAKKSRK